MMAFGVCISDEVAFSCSALRGVLRIAEHDSALLTATGVDEATGRGEILDGFASLEGVEALVLLHEQLEILDADFIPKLRRRLATAELVAVTTEAYEDTGCLAVSPRAASVLRPELTAGTSLELPRILDAARAAGVPVCAETSAVRWHGQPKPGEFADDDAVPADEASGDTDGYYGWERPELVALVPPTARRALDVGCGAGALGRLLKQERPSTMVCGVELFRPAAARAAQWLDRVWQRNLDETRTLPVPDGYFDVMIFGDVLEHLRDPEAALVDLLRYLADDGVVIASVPNVVHWSVLGAALVNDSWEYTDAGLLDRTHVHLFTLREALQMLDRVGLNERWHLGTTSTGAEGQLIEGLVAAARAVGADAADVRARLATYQYHIGVRRGAPAGR